MYRSLGNAVGTSARCLFTQSTVGRRWLSTIVLAEFDKSSGEINQGTRSAIAAARCFDGDIVSVVLGHGPPVQTAAKGLSEVKAMSKVYVCDSECLEHDPIAEASSVLLSIIKSHKADRVVAPVSTFSKDIIPHTAARLDAQPITDIVNIQDSDTYVRCAYAGNAMYTVRSKEQIKFLTIRPTNFAPDMSSDGACEICNVDAPASPPLTEFVSEEVQKADRPQLATAKIVVSGGRAFKDKDSFENLLFPLCDKLNAAIGASRAAVDSGMAANDLQVGQTGKVVAPDLYFAIGISGAIQHVAGMKDSKVVVAINKDPEAPIFKIANYGLVGDVFQVLPELCEKL